MNSTALLLVNFQETRRRSEKIWRRIPADAIHWKPDDDAFSIIEMIRHVLEGEYIYHQLVLGRGELKEVTSPWENRPYTSILSEIEFAHSYRKRFLEDVSHFTQQELGEVIIERKDLDQRRSLGDYLLRIAYHESVHAGQLLNYLRQKGATRASIWD